jgi:hypothetical protein
MSVLAAGLNDMGDLVCPQCKTNIITPTGLNPYKGSVAEKMVVNAGFSIWCPLCEILLFATAEVAKQHNRYWFPDDPEFGE